jgi:uncharacterized phage protein (TIGR01671 family)
MREHKYLAWHKRYKKIYKVLHLHLASDEGPWATVEGFDIIEDKHIHIKIQPKDIELMEFTGKVHNGVEIYDGFILKWEKQATETEEYMCQTDEVVFKDGAFVLKNIEGWCPVYQHFDEYFDNLGEDESVTVIGNRYDNPEFLEVSDETHRSNA